MTGTDNSADNAPMPFSHLFALRDLHARGETRFLLKPDSKDCAVIAAALGLLALKKLRFEGIIAPTGRKDWVLKATLGATVEQTCVATLVPVRTRIDEKVTRSFLAEFETPEEGSESEIESDEAVEPLGDAIDAGQVMTETLALALPLYPRTGDVAETVSEQAAPPGVTPMQDKDLNPFAALGALRDKLPDPD